MKKIRSKIKSKKRIVKGIGPTLTPNLPRNHLPTPSLTLSLSLLQRDGPGIPLGCSYINSAPRQIPFCFNLADRNSAMMGHHPALAFGAGQRRRINPKSAP